MSFLISTPFPGFLDTAGDPLENGKIYIGQPNLNAQNFPVTAYYDAALTLPAAQPIRTSGGYPWLNGGPAKIFTAGTYSILVKDKNDQFIYEDRNAGISGLVSGMFSGTVSDLNFDPTALGLVVDEVRLLVSTLNPSNKPTGGDDTYYLLTLAKVSSSEYRLVMAQGGALGKTYNRTYASGLWRSWGTVGGAPISLTTGSPYTLTSGATPTLEINSTTNPYIVNLPQASTCAGFRVKIVNASTLTTGLIKIIPFAGDFVGPMPVNVAIYLQNVDSSGWQNGKKYIELVSDGTSTWAVEGQWMPEPSGGDTAGTQYFLGKLRLLSQNINSRLLASATFPALGAFQGPITATVSGVPIGAKAVRVKVRSLVSSTAAGTTISELVFTENTTPPIFESDQPALHTTYTAAGAASVLSYYVTLDIPLDSLGRFYIFNFKNTNVTVASSTVFFYSMGYYMGD